MSQIDTDTATSLSADLSGATDRDSWLARIDAVGEAAGYFQTVGPRHWALFSDESPTLLVSFETIASARARPGQMPLAQTIATARGWSHLCLIADGETWYRDPAVWSFFDRQVDDCFFEDFDRVVFYGAGMAGYAACAYAVAAPGATVLAVSPYATLSPAIASWDSRHPKARRLDFTSRYGYAPDMVEGAGQVMLIHDPLVRADVMHAALFRAPYVAQLAARHGGAALEDTLIRMGALAPLIEAAGEGRLDAALFHQLWRQRRNDGPYLKTLLALAAQQARPAREKMICRSVTTRMRAPKFQRRLLELQAADETVA